jgi:hypothetical protein
MYTVHCTYTVQCMYSNTVTQGLKIIFLGVNDIGSHLQILVYYVQENLCEIILIKQAFYLGQQHWKCRWAELCLETCKSWDRADRPQIPARRKSRSAILPTREQKGGRESPRRWRSRSTRPGSSAGGAAGPRAGRNRGSVRYTAHSRIPANHSSQSHRRPEQTEGSHGL